MLVLTAALLGGGIAFAYSAAQVPLPDQLPPPEVTVVADVDGKDAGMLAVEENRQIIPLEQIPEHLQRSVMAAEDRDFYQHPGISVKGLGRAFWVNLTGGQVQGGSTITQQYVKNVYLEQDRTLARKLNEAVMSLKLENEREKNEILEGYLNTIYFGRGAYGIEAAAKTYFGKPASDLAPHESAYLAAVIKSPEFYANPDNADRAVERRNYILDAMQTEGWLPAAEVATAKAAPLKYLERGAGGFGTTPAENQYFVEKVRLFLNQEIGETRVAQGGLRVQTTLDREMQADAKAAVEGVLDAEGPKAGMVALDPTTGAVRAMYGGRDFGEQQFNLATDAQRQAGSTMKPFVLAKGLENGLSVRSNFEAPSCTDLGGQELCNYNKQDYGTIDLVEATRVSANTPFLKLILDVGPASVEEISLRSGMDARLVEQGEQAPNIQRDASLALGSNTASTLQLASAFSTFASRGEHRPPHIVTRVEDSSGQVLYEFQPESNRVMEENIADTVNSVLNNVTQNGTAKEAGIGREMACKTGTTNDSVDARIVCYTPELVTSVWVGFDDQTPMNGITGGSLQGPGGISKAFMSAALADVPASRFVEPNLEVGEVLNPTTTSTTTSSTTTTIDPNLLLPGDVDTTVPPNTDPDVSLPTTTLDGPTTTQGVDGIEDLPGRPLPRNPGG